MTDPDRSSKPPRQARQAYDESDLDSLPAIVDVPVGLTPTLSCKSRLTRLPHRGTAAAATDENSQGARCGWRDAVQFEPPGAGRPPGQRTGGFCQLVSVVRRRHLAEKDVG